MELREEHWIGPRKNKTFKVECPTTYLSTITFENGTLSDNIIF